MEKILVTSALPYANGPIHFGHVAGAYLPADIFVRFNRLLGNDVLFICGTDEHGVAITISAEQIGRTPAEHVSINRKLIKEIFDKCDIVFDNFSRTSLPLHTEISQRFFTELKENGYLFEEAGQQYYCTECQKFLADRYLTGKCPYCGHPAARGDECTKCGKWLESVELTDPRCKICGATPERRDTRHWYLKLEDFTERLSDWLSTKQGWKENVKAFVQSMLSKGLKSRPITRDMQWGVPVPGEIDKDKVLYVWFEAPIGYISSTVEWAAKRGEPDKWKEYWQNPKTKLYHFIGKDNIPFHCVFWPAVLMGQTTKYILPENVPSNEWLTLEGRQFSKSDGWYIDTEHFFEHFSVDSLRYCLAANAPETSDTEFTWKDFQLRNNSELANIYGNLANRVLRFIETHFDSTIPDLQRPTARDKTVLEQAEACLERAREAYSRFEIRRVCYEIMELGRVGNRFFDELAPWDTLKNDPADCRATMFTGVTILKYLAYMSFPVIPNASKRLWSFLGITRDLESVHWDELTTVALGGNKLVGVDILFKKIEDEEIAREIQLLNQHSVPAQKQYEPLKSEVGYDDFAKLDIRVAKIVEAEPVPKADKLLKLVVDLGFEKREVVAGIALSYRPEDLIGRRVILLANLAPKKLRGVLSHGMLLAGGDGEAISLLGLEGDMEPGSIVR